MTTATTPAVNKTLLIVLGGIMAVAALFFLVVDPLLLSADAAPAPATAPVPVSAGAVPAVEAIPEPTVEDPGPETFQIYNTRDPFEQLVQIAPVPTAAPAAPQPPATSPEAPAADATAADGADPGDQPASAEVAAAPPAPQAPAPQILASSVKLNDVVDGGDNRLLAQVVINGQSYEAAEGQAFTDDIAVLALSGKCGTFLYGQQRFTLCQGEEVLTP